MSILHVESTNALFHRNVCCSINVGYIRQATSIEVIDVKTSSAIIRWTVTQRYPASAPDSFTVLYGYYSSQLTFTSRVVPSNPTDMTYSVEISSLSTATQYFFQVRTQDMYGMVRSDLMSLFTCT